MDAAKRIFNLLDPKAKKFFYKLVFAAFLLSLIEMVGISAIMPIIDFSVNFNQIKDHVIYQNVSFYFIFESELEFVIFFAIMTIFFYIFRGLLNIIFIRNLAIYSEGFGAQISKMIFTKYLNLSFVDYSLKNQSTLSKTIISEAAFLSWSLKAMLYLVSEFFVVVTLLTMLLIVDFYLTLGLTLVLIVSIGLTKKYVTQKIKKIGVVREDSQNKLYENLNQLLRNFEQIKIQSSSVSEKTIETFSSKVNKLSEVNSQNLFMQEIPRLFIETFGFILIVLILVWFMYSSKGEISNSIPIIGLFTVALIRCLPSFNRITSSYNLIQYYHKSSEIISSDLMLDIEKFKDGDISFKDSIQLVDVEFKYANKKLLNKVNITIKKGEKIALLGGSGSGKTTLTRILMGLIEPSSGHVLIDNTQINREYINSWRAKVGYISQHIFLFDSTIEKNIIFGRDLDKRILDKVSRQAKIFDFIDPEKGLQTFVGDSGIQLSGGQRQRIAIARALYGNPEILVLDEATSSLDEKNERKILDEVFSMSSGITLIFVTHKEELIRNFDKIYTIQGGEIIKS